MSNEIRFVIKDMTPSDWVDSVYVRNLVIHSKPHGWLEACGQLLGNMNKKPRDGDQLLLDLGD